MPGRGEEIVERVTPSSYAYVAMGWVHHSPVLHPLLYQIIKVKKM